MTTVDSMLETLDTRSARPDVTWTTGNIAEACPGVFTALGLSFMHAPMEKAFRRVFYDLGVFSAAELQVPDEVEDCFWGVFDGWAAGNIDMFREIANRMPGTTASAVERQLFGFTRPDTVDQNTIRRYPIIAYKTPRFLVRTPERHDAMVAGLRQWRLEQLSRIDGLDERGCIAVLADARRRYENMMSIHMGVSMLSSSLAERVAAIAQEAGHEGLEGALLSGVGTDENELAHDLWALAHDRISLREFTDRHGYHGPNEGQLSAMSWREDPAPVLAHMREYRAISAESPRFPRRRSAAQARAREQSMRQLLAAVPRGKRAFVHRVVGVAARYLALRQQGKVGYLLTFDVTRAAVRRLGVILHDSGLIDDPEDVFHLGYDALVTGIRGDQRDLVVERAADYRRRQSIRLPKAWTGAPEVTSIAGVDRVSLAVGDVLTGVAASGGVVEGRARIVREPDKVELDDGDILVCETTDPAWVPLFLVAGGVVNDHGGMLSHGPIVARELGIPCVCGTETGSRRIVEGQLLRVDGDRGTVEVVADSS